MTQPAEEQRRGWTLPIFLMGIVLVILGAVGVWIKPEDSLAFMALLVGALMAVAAITVAISNKYDSM